MQKKGDELRKDANGLVDMMRVVVKQDLDLIDSTVVCVVESVNDDGTLNLYVLPDRSNTITNIINQCRFDFYPGDTALLYKVSNRLSNSFVIAKYNAKQADAQIYATNAMTNIRDLQDKVKNLEQQVQFLMEQIQETEPNTIT